MGKYHFSYEEKITIIREHKENHKTLKAICEGYDSFVKVNFGYFSFKQK